MLKEKWFPATFQFSDFVICAWGYVEIFLGVRKIRWRLQRWFTKIYQDFSTNLGYEAYEGHVNRLLSGRPLHSCTQNESSATLHTAVVSRTTFDRNIYRCHLTTTVLSTILWTFLYFTICKLNFDFIRITRHQYVDFLFWGTKKNLDILGFQNCIRSDCATMRRLTFVSMTS